LKKYARSWWKLKKLFSKILAVIAVLVCFIVVAELFEVIKAIFLFNGTLIISSAKQLLIKAVIAIPFVYYLYRRYY
jgi:hypothetical protein